MHAKVRKFPILKRGFVYKKGKGKKLFLFDRERRGAVVKLHQLKDVGENKQRVFNFYPSPAVSMHKNGLASNRRLI